MKSLVNYFAQTLTTHSVDSREKLVEEERRVETFPPPELLKLTPPPPHLNLKGRAPYHLAQEGLKKNDNVAVSKTQAISKTARVVIPVDGKGGGR